MAIKSKNQQARPEIDLTGPAGNAFCLLGYMRSFGKQLSWSKEKISQVSEEMRSGDYENLIAVFDREFGEYVDLIR